MSQTPETRDQIEELRRVLLKPDVLVDRISPIIADILTEQIEQSGDQIAKAIAPVMGEALRRQVYQAREDIIDALYPVIGQMINRAIVEAVRNLARNVDTRLRQSMRPQSLWRMAQARMRGVSISDYELRESLPFAVQEIFLIQRDTGLLICHDSFYPDGNVLADRDLVSGMLTAIRDFARDAFDPSSSEELGSIEYESRNIILVAGSNAYLAAVVEGIEPRDFRDQMRQVLVALHTSYYDRLKLFDGSDAELIIDVHTSLNTTFAPTPLEVAEEPRSLSLSQKIIAALLVLFIIVPLPLGCGWWAFNVEQRLAALAVPPPTPLPPTPTATATPSPTPSATPSPTPSATPSPSASATPQPSATITRTPRPSPTPTSTPTRFFGVMIGNVFLRDAPSETGNRTSIVAPLGAPVEVLAQNGTWYRVRVTLPDQPSIELVGWVPTEWVSLLKPVPVELITPTAVP